MAGQGDRRRFEGEQRDGATTSVAASSTRMMTAMTRRRGRCVSGWVEAAITKGC